MDLTQGLDMRLFASQTLLLFFTSATYDAVPLLEHPSSSVIIRSSFQCSLHNVVLYLPFNWVSAPYTMFVVTGAVLKCLDILQCGYVRTS